MPSAVEVVDEITVGGGRCRPDILTRRLRLFSSQLSRRRLPAVPSLVRHWQIGYI